MNLDADTKQPDEPCTDCALGKMHRLPFKTGRKKTHPVGELIHSDVCGPMQIPSPKGARYYVAFKDGFSGYRIIYFIKQKSDVPDNVKHSAGILKS